MSRKDKKFVEVEGKVFVNSAFAQEVLSSNKLNEQFSDIEKEKQERVYRLLDIFKKRHEEDTIHLL